MNDKDCGSCDYQGQVTMQRAECLIDFESHKRGYRCPEFKIYDQTKDQKARRTMALEKRKERAAKERMEFEEALAQKDREHADKMAEKDREWAEKLQQERMKFDIKWSLIQIVLGAVLGAVLGIAGTLLVQALSRH